MKTILVVDDDDSVRRFAILALQQHGYTTLEASDGITGLEQFFQHLDDIGLVLSDIVMPPPSGPEMIKEILRVKPSLAVGFASGTAERSHLPDDLKVIPILRKPYSHSDLLRFVEERLSTGNS
jgi:two-component system cell cycle sensor histidine kinase/response regulator CckA